MSKVETKSIYMCHKSTNWVVNCKNMSKEIYRLCEKNEFQDRINSNCKTVIKLGLSIQKEVVRPVIIFKTNVNRRECIG